MYYRLRAPYSYTEPTEERTPANSTAVTVRGHESLRGMYLSVGAGSRRFSLTREEAWALRRCLGAALDADGEPPAWLGDPAIG